MPLNVPSIAFTVGENVSLSISLNLFIFLSLNLFIFLSPFIYLSIPIYLYFSPHLFTCLYVFILLSLNPSSSPLSLNGPTLSDSPPRNAAPIQPRYESSIPPAQFPVASGFQDVGQGRLLLGDIFPRKKTEKLFFFPRPIAEAKRILPRRF